MAITRTDYEIFKLIRDELPPRPSILEIGESEFYGDVPIEMLLTDIDEYAPLGDRETLARAAIFRGSAGDSHAMARDVYAALFSPSLIVAIDMHGTDRAHRADLNMPLQTREYDLVYNTGTAEHVFYFGRVMQTCHEACKHNGLMMHCFPFTGLIDHGFYAIQPTLIRDLADANGYDILHWTIGAIGYAPDFLPGSSADYCVDHIHEKAKVGAIPANSWMHVVYRKAEDSEFRIPMQRIYTDKCDRETAADWKVMR